MQISNTRIDMKLTGKKLSYLAKLRGYSVKDIQEYLGLACPQPVYRWYKGIILPSVDNLLRLSELFGSHMEELLVTDSMKRISTFDIITNNSVAMEKRILLYVSKLCA
ncbi:MAG: helix-turn-helix domain-containing protein [Lachnospiraceae bacterium]|nr:helix-turn-helix domain-containing protein [Lachnospiraceae bacterium]